ncbi:hypothetical protein Thermo_01387 [Thermoplasmatales archaeon]|nr:hypothetical protein Thermo_01387 [Thermoplasmatales archaeon]
MDPQCSICNGNADDEFKRVEVWKNMLWRITISTYRMVEGFCYLEPVRHIPSITDLDGEEANEFGAILARTSSALKTVMHAKLVYIYIFGDHIPHLHVHLAPHKDGDIYTNDVIRHDAKMDESVYSRDRIKPLIEELRRAIHE